MDHSQIRAPAHTAFDGFPNLTLRSRSMLLSNTTTNVGQQNKQLALLVRGWIKMYTATGKTIKVLIKRLATLPQGVILYRSSTLSGSSSAVKKGGYVYMCLDHFDCRNDKSQKRAFVISGVIYILTSSSVFPG